MSYWLYRRKSAPAIITYDRPHRANLYGCSVGVIATALPCALAGGNTAAPRWRIRVSGDNEAFVIDLKPSDNNLSLYEVVWAVGIVK